MTEAAVRILVVDDDEEDYRILADLLRSIGPDRYELSWASTYEMGLEALRTSRCDVCLLDYRLGGHSGLDLLAEVTPLVDHPEIILMTGVGDRGVDVAAAKGGAADYLVKGELTAELLERSIRYARERGRTLKELREARELAQLNLAKSAFVASMSHEIRTPMNAILGMADILWESPLNSDQKLYVEVFRRAGSGLLALINDVLDLSKIETGHLELERVPFDLEDVVDHAVELTAVKARAKGLDLLSHFAPDVPGAVMGDPTRLRQVLINLLGNAVKFTHSGEVVLTVRTCGPAGSGHLEFTVSDTGIGIPEDKLEAIFEDFIQGDASTARKYGGTGLGLGISRRLAIAMGGSLTVSSCVGKGSTFVFRVQLDPTPENGRRWPMTVESLCDKRVLLIDDNATNCFILQETLRVWGLKSDAFRRATEALAHLRGAMATERAYSLVMIDSHMPEMDGFAGAAEIRRIAQQIPIVMLSSDVRPGDISRRAEAGLSGYAVKPVTRANLLRLICEALTSPAAPTNPSPPGRSDEEDRVKPVPPATILIAEDSEDNRLLLRVYLKDCPYQLSFEEDGRAVVERFARSEFDLILMDVQMPVMDGLTATRAIRALEQQRGAHPIPILALTADAGSQNIERSCGAGCNAHLSKPISKVELLRAIEKHRRRTPAAEGAQPAHREAIRIDVPAGLEEIAPGYLESRKREAPKMLELLAASDFARLTALAHNLKGTGAGYGFPDLSRLGAALEESAKKADEEALRKQILQLGEYLDQVRLAVPQATVS